MLDSCIAFHFKVQLGGSAGAVSPQTCSWPKYTASLTEVEGLQVVAQLAWKYGELLPISAIVIDF